MICGGAASKLYTTAHNIVTRRTYFCLMFNRKQTFAYALYATTATANLSSKRRNLASDFGSCCDSNTFSKLGSIYDYNKRMGELGRRGNVDAARRLFDNIPERDKVSYNSMISIYLKHDKFHQAEMLYYEIPEGMKNIVADSAMVHAYAEAGRIDRAEEVFDKMPERNGFAWTSLISGYFKLGRVDDAVELFGRMPDREKSVITWTNVVRGFARNGLLDEARCAFDRMSLKNGVAWASMIKAYVEMHQVDEAFKLFQVMPQHNLYAWSIMICGFMDHDRVNEARDLFDSMPWRNAVSWTTIVTGLARNGMTELAREYFNKTPNKDVPAWNAMIAAYTNEGRMFEAGELFKLMPRRNVVTWNAMIDGYSKHRQEDEAFQHFILMLRSCIRPNERTLTSLLTSCGGILGVLQAHGLIVRLGFEIETSLTNTLITMYYKSGDVTSARIAFQCLEAKDAVTWTAMITAYSNHGFGKLALQTFAQMLRTGHNPDQITFLGVLSACNHAGFVKKGQMLFDSMTRGYGLEPTAEHYSCLVDILGRAGLVKEAMKVVEEMPPDKYDGVVLGALLGACRLHGGDGLIDLIGDELIELEPANYALLANAYAASGKWDKFSQLRKTMKEREVKKVPGFSQIDVNGKRHVIFAGDRSHPQMNEIYMFLHDNLIPQLQDFGSKTAKLSLIL
ncbi:hypothetical protein ACS0TY_034327 [Phlomoides rotata]